MTLEIFQFTFSQNVESFVEKPTPGFVFELLVFTTADVLPNDFKDSHTTTHLFERRIISFFRTTKPEYRPTPDVKFYVISMTLHGTVYICVPVTGLLGYCTKFWCFNNNIYIYFALATLDFQLKSNPTSSAISSDTDFGSFDARSSAKLGRGPIPDQTLAPRNPRLWRDREFRRGAAHVSRRFLFILGFQRGHIIYLCYWFDDY